MKKAFRIFIYTILTLIILALLAYGVSKSDFTNIKKYDDGKDPNSATGFKTRAAQKRQYSREVKIESDNSANLGDFTISVSNRKKLIANISLTFKENNKYDWLLGKSVNGEIVDKGDILRNSVIQTMSNSGYSNPNNENMKNRLKDNINKHLSNGQVEEVYFNRFILQ